MRTSAMFVFAAFLGTAAAFADIKSSPDDVEPLDIFEKIPNPTLTTLGGAKVSLADAIGGKPSVLIFFRGGWCPYCQKHLAALKNVIPEIKSMGFEVIAISPDTVAGVTNMVAEQEIDYTILSDSDFEAIQDFRLAFKLDDETLKLYEGYGLKLEPMPETGDTVLPVPAVYVVDAAGNITFRHYDVDYRQRLDPDLLLQAIKSMQ